MSETVWNMHGSGSQFVREATYWHHSLHVTNVNLWICVGPWRLWLHGQYFFLPFEKLKTRCVCTTVSQDRGSWTGNGRSSWRWTEGYIHCVSLTVIMGGDSYVGSFWNLPVLAARLQLFSSLAKMLPPSCHHPGFEHSGCRIGPAVRVDFRRLYPANAKTPMCCPSDDNRTKVTNSVTSARSLWWHLGPYFWPADLTRMANPISEERSINPNSWIFRYRP